MKTDVLPIIVGLSLCGASAALLYIWFKTKDNDQDTVDSPKSKKKDSKLECVIPNNIVPLVVGRAGANIKSIEEKTGTTIKFREKDDKSQICEIIGNSENIQKAAALIRQDASPPPIITEELYVPQTACGKIIGRCGEVLQEICRKSMAKVYVDAGDRSDAQTRRIMITGTQAHVNIAKNLIQEKVRLDAELRKTVEETELKREPRGSSKHSGSESSLTNQSPSSSMDAIHLKGEKLPSNTEGQLEVYVSAIASPSRFWLQLVGPQSKQLDTLVETMSKYYDEEENRKIHKIADPYLGQIVTAVFKYDGKWYRAEIVGILPNEFNPRNVVLDLYFVDFGDSEYVSPHEVFELRTDFLTLRFQAIECFLANVKAANSNERDAWHPDSISRFEELTYVAKWQKMHARIVTTKERKYADPIKREGSPVPGVELYDTVEGLEKNIAEELIREGYALEEHSHPDKPNQVLRLDGGRTENDTTVDINNGAIASPIANIGKLNKDNIHTNGHDTIKASNNGTNDRPATHTSNVRYTANNDIDKFTAICENTTNENFENIKIDTRNQSVVNAFIAAEKQNGLNANNDTQLAPMTDKTDTNLNAITNAVNSPLLFQDLAKNS